MDKIQFKKKLFISGTSSVITIPEEIQKFLEIEIGDIVIMQPETGKKGKYVSLWKGEQE